MARGDYDAASFQPTVLCSMPLEALDPSLALGFYCDSAASYGELCDALRSLEAMAAGTPLLSVSDEPYPVRYAEREPSIWIPDEMEDEEEQELDASPTSAADRQESAGEQGATACSGGEAWSTLSVTRPSSIPATQRTSHPQPDLLATAAGPELAGSYPGPETQESFALVSAPGTSPPIEITPGDWIPTPSGGDCAARNSDNAAAPVHHDGRTHAVAHGIRNLAARQGSRDWAQKPDAHQQHVPSPTEDSSLAGRLQSMRRTGWEML